MTGLLNDLLRDRADHLDAPELDLAVITRDGDRSYAVGVPPSPAAWPRPPWWPRSPVPPCSRPGRR